jgi:ABC-type uncharacterized transport system ATPase subunit
MTVLHLGKVLCSGDPHEVLADSRVAEVYLGSTVTPTLEEIT